MLIRQIPLKHGIDAPAANITNHTEIEEALNQLGIPRPKKVIVLIGGAYGIGVLDKLAVKKAVEMVARLAEEMNAVVVDGGTQAGVMTEIGSQRKKHQFSFPLIGVAFDSLLTKEDPKKILDPNHTHFIFIPGEEWGDESSWIARIASRIAAGEKSITVLINGGEISQQDVQCSLNEDRHVFIMRGTGRLADEITLTRKVTAVDVSDKSDQIQGYLREKLS
jgi:hypothetical protein